MKRFSLQQKSLFILSALGIITTLSFQNCGQGFRSTASDGLFPGVSLINSAFVVSRNELTTVARSIKPDVLAETNPGGLPTGFFYAPAIVRDNGRFHMFYCSSGDSTSWDKIRYRTSTDGREWKDEKVVLAAVDGAKSSDRSACDPSVVKFRAPGDSKDFYYLFYTGNEVEAYCSNPASPGFRAPNPDACGQGLIFVARSEKIDGPYEKYMGNGLWERWGLDSPQTLKAYHPTGVIKRRNSGQDVMSPHSYGAGQSSVVVQDGQLMMWYHDDSGSQQGKGKTLLSRSADGINWSAGEDTGLISHGSSDVKYDPETKSYVMMSINVDLGGAWGDGNHANGSVITRGTSADGKNWSSFKVVYANNPSMNYIHNIGIGGDARGFLEPSYSITVFGAPVQAPLACAAPSCWAQWNLDGILENHAPERLFRIYNPNNGDHVFTSSEPERRFLAANGWSDETSRSFDVYRFKGAGLVAVYRLYNPNNSGHYYTTSIYERASLVTAGWVYEKIEGFVFEASQTDTTEIYHLYNPNGGQHLFTIGTGERDGLLQAGWQQQKSLGFAPVKSTADVRPEKAI